MGLAAIGSSLQFGLGVDELVVLGEMAEVGNAFGTFEDVAVDGDEGSDLRPRLGHLPRIPGAEAQSDDCSVLPTRIRVGEQVVERGPYEPQDPLVLAVHLLAVRSASSIVVRTVPSKRSGVRTVNPSPRGGRRGP